MFLTECFLGRHRGGRQLYFLSRFSRTFFLHTAVMLGKWLSGPPSKWLESDLKSDFLTRKVTQKWLFRVKKLLFGSLLSLFGGGPESHFCGHFWATLNFSGFGGFWLVPSELLLHTAEWAFSTLRLAAPRRDPCEAQLEDQIRRRERYLEVMQGLEGMGGSGCHVRSV